MYLGGRFQPYAVAIQHHGKLPSLVQERVAVYFAVGLLVLGGQGRRSGQAHYIWIIIDLLQMIPTLIFRELGSLLLRTRMP